MEGGSRRKFLLGMMSSSTAAVAGCGDLNFGASGQSGGSNTFSGVVTDARGDAVQNAAVRVLGPEEGIEQPLGVDRSNADGSFTVNHEQRPEMLVLATKGRWFKPIINLTSSDLKQVNEIQLDQQRIDGPRAVTHRSGLGLGSLSVWRHVDSQANREVLEIEIVTSGELEPYWKDLPNLEYPRGAVSVSLPESAVVEHNEQDIYHIDREAWGTQSDQLKLVEKYHPLRTFVPARAFTLNDTLSDEERQEWQRREEITEAVVGTAPIIGGFLGLFEAYRTVFFGGVETEPDVILGETELEPLDPNEYDSVPNGWQKPALAVAFQIPIRYPEPPDGPARIHMSATTKRLNGGKLRFRYERQFDVYVSGEDTTGDGGIGLNDRSTSFTDNFTTQNTGYDPDKWSVYRNQHLEGGFAKRASDSGLQIGNSAGVLALYTNTAFEPPTLITFDVRSWSPAFGSGHYIGWVEDGYNTNERPGSVRKQTADSVIIDFNTNRGDPYVELLSQSGDGIAVFGENNGSQEETARFLKPADGHDLFSGGVATTFEVVWRKQSVTARMNGSEVAQLSNYVPRKSMPLYVITHDWTGGNPEMILNSIQVSNLD